jgi:hypothetical protein
MEIILDGWGNEIVYITNDDGSTLSMTKAHYDTLASELAPIPNPNS